MGFEREAMNSNLDLNSNDASYVDVDADVDVDFDMEAADDDSDLSEHTENIKLKLPAPPQHHPELEQFFAFDINTYERVAPNGTPTKFDNDIVSGCFLPMIRTSDADDEIEPYDTTGSPSNDSVSNYFRKKRRRFELQVQMRFKKPPEGKVWFGFEIEEPLDLGPMQNLFARAALKFAENKHKETMHYSMSGTDWVSEADADDGKQERPHLAFAVESVFDRIVVSKQGEQLPHLGGDIHEDPESIKRRKKTPMTFNTTDTYTMAVWSAYVDFLDWKVNVPAIRPLSISKLIGEQPIFLTIYTLKPDSNMNHYDCNISHLMKYEISHARKSRIGPAREAWMKCYSVRESSWLQADSLILTEPDGEFFSDDMMNSIENGVKGENLSDIGWGDNVYDNEYYSRPEFDNEAETREDLGEGKRLACRKSRWLGTHKALEKADVGNKENG